MPFTPYKETGNVFKEYQIVLMEIGFLAKVSFMSNEAFKANIEFSLSEVVYDLNCLMNAINRFFIQGFFIQYEAAIA